MNKNLKVVELSQVVAIEKNAQQEFRISVREYGGYKLLNCHVWYRDDDGQMRPSKGDLSVRVEKARDVIAAMGKVLTESGF